MHLKRGGDGKYTCLLIHLNKKCIFRAWKGTGQVRWWERPDSPMCKGIAALWVGLQVPCGAPLGCKESPLSPGIQGISRHLCISLLHGSTQGSVGEGKDPGKPLVFCNSCRVPGGILQQKHGEGAVGRQLWESFCIANWEGDRGTDKLVVFPWGFGAYCQIEQSAVHISVFPKTSNRVSHSHHCLVPVRISSSIFCSEGCIAGGLGHSGTDGKTGSWNKAFSSSSSETRRKSWAQSLCASKAQLLAQSQRPHSYQILGWLEHEDWAWHTCIYTLHEPPISSVWGALKWVESSLTKLCYWGSQRWQDSTGQQTQKKITVLWPRC